jgi:hypothetical protein
MGPGDELNSAAAAQHTNKGLRDFFILVESVGAATVHLT